MYGLVFIRMIPLKFIQVPLALQSDYHSALHLRVYFSTLLQKLYMTIHMYRVHHLQTGDSLIYLRAIEQEFPPAVGWRFVDVQTEEVFEFKNIFYSNNKICAIIEEGLSREFDYYHQALG